MTQNEYQKLARAFLDIWQQQLTRTMNDRDMVKNMMHAMQQMQQTGASAFKEQYDPAYRHAAPAFGTYDDELVELAERLANCEERLVALESRVDIYQKPAGHTTKQPEKPKESTKRSPKSGSKATASGKNASGSKRGSSAAKPAKARTVTRSALRSGDYALADRTADDAIASLKKAVLGTKNKGKSKK